MLKLSKCTFIHYCWEGKMIQTLWWEFGNIKWNYKYNWSRRYPSNNITNTWIRLLIAALCVISKYCKLPEHPSLGDCWINPGTMNTSPLNKRMRKLSMNWYGVMMSKKILWSEKSKHKRLYLVPLTLLNKEEEVRKCTYYQFIFPKPNPRKEKTETS